ncbi:MAG: TonB-dependent receptor [Bacteroidetes bacterium]|nr:TonB-dependent receptor [Bacteroidota bacterium]
MFRYYLFLFMGFSLLLNAQDKFTISGYIKDQKNGEALIGANILKKGTSIGVSANEYGFYSLTLPKGKHTIVATLIGYKIIEFEVNLEKNISKNIELLEDSKQLDEVVITGEAEDKNVKSMEMGVAKLDIKQIKKIPALFGEVDVIRSIQLLPGVSTVGEGATGFNVRGGNIDQNLILLDEAPVYNSSHLFGFFSVFNPDAVKDVKLIKGGIPSQYGGRVSSILDIRMKEGNSKKLSGAGGIGTIFSRFSLEGPIKKDKASFIIAGRRSYIDALIKPFVSSTNALKTADFYFYDLTAKLNWRINDKNTVFASSYFGRDVFGSSAFKFNWGNATGTVRWNHVFNNKIFMNLTAFYSNYDYSLEFNMPALNQSFKWRSNIENYSIKPDFSWYLNNRNTIRFGFQALSYAFLPYDATGQTQAGNSISFVATKRYGLESSVYISNEQKLLPRLTLEYGLRVSLFNFIGPGKAYNFRDTTANTEKAASDTLIYNKLANIKQYINPEPRFSLNYIINQYSSIKASYNRMAQYLQLISNTAASTPLDVYTIATNNLKPLIADQGSVGYFRNFKDNMFETSVEVFYKYLQNQLDYIDNANLFINPTVEGQLLQGLGRAYGSEFFIKKTKGRINGWVSYTLSHTERLVNGISNNQWFVSRYNRTHVLNIVTNIDITKNWSISLNFVYLSGTPSTFPNTRIDVQGYYIPYNTTGMRNNYQIPSYNRLDLGATYNFKNNDKHKFKQSLVFSVYNVYNRRNAYSVYFKTTLNTNGTLTPQAEKFSVIGSVVPAITYNFNF